MFKVLSAALVAALAAPAGARSLASVSFVVAPGLGREKAAIFRVPSPLPRPTSTGEVSVRETPRARSKIVCQGLFGLGPLEIGVIVAVAAFVLGSDHPRIKLQCPLCAFYQRASLTF